MITYVINLCADTKNTDRYDKVAVNKFPIIIRCNDEKTLKEKLSNEYTSNFVKEHLKHKHLYETSMFFIRAINKNEITEFCWDVVNLTKIEY